MHHTHLLNRSLTLIGVIFIFVSCGTVPIDHAAKVPSKAIETPHKTFLGRLFTPIANNYPGQSGFLLLEKGEDALLWRGALTDVATSTLDAQYFIWEDDNVGTIAAERLLRAAERGVRVRVLLDDLLLNTQPEYLALLDAHPKIEIRVYNPVGSGYGPDRIRKQSVLRDFKHLNRRMHNKVFIADSSIAIIGGRNIADEYFDMSTEFNCRDREVLAVGPIVQDITTSFDDYWNSRWSATVTQFISTTADEEQQRYYEELHQYAADPENFPLRFYGELNTIKERLLQLSERLIWGKAILIYDIPGKNDDPDRLDAFGRSGEALTRIALQSQQEILSETPYLFLMPGTFNIIDELRKRDVRIRILTNSLASTDNVIAFSGYFKQRQMILKAGVELYELKSEPELRESVIQRYALLENKPPLALHAKTAVFDRQVVFLGSFNLDPRSTHLNTEIGVLIYSDELAQQVAEIIEQDMRPENSWQVLLVNENDLAWVSRHNGKEVRLSKDPEAGIVKSMQLRFYSLLPLSAYL